MFSRILIANRGEIACRIIKTAQQMGIHCIAVYSQADIDSQHVRMADEAFLLGPAQSSDSYLRADKILQIAKLSDAQAIHPGYGFLSENAEFATACEQLNIVFIGPPAAAIAAMGSKSAAKEIMANAQVPLVPGYHGADQDPELLASEAVKCGFPLLLKAVAGGGGKGMRVVESIEEFALALSSAQREASNAFGNSDMLLERYLSNTRHIEVQVFFDQQGNGIYLSQRDCSIQRRHQKIIEEAPAPGISQKVVEAMGEAALDAARAINYVGAGTVEFLYNEDDSFYFMEMNTRLQVEHPVTEMITNTDLVEWQLRIAHGAPLPLTQAQVQVTGHAIECRIYAEDPNNDFLPATGHLSYLRTPTETEQLRVDTGVVQGDEVSVYYDPMISKLIVHAESRPQAIAKMAQALQDYRIVGVKNNLSFLHKIITNEVFKHNIVNTHFIEQYRADLFANALDIEQCMAIASVAKILSYPAAKAQDIYAGGVQWRMNQSPHYHITWLEQGIKATDQHEDSHLCHLLVEELQDNLLPNYCANAAKNLSEPPPYRAFKVTGSASAESSTASNNAEYLIAATLQGDELAVRINGQTIKLHAYINHSQLILFYYGTSIQFQAPNLVKSAEEVDNKGALTAPMNGRVIAVLVKAGQTVKAATPLIVIEAMKMEHSILAPYAGKVTDIFYQEDSLVTEGDKLIAMQDATVSQASNSTDNSELSESKAI